MAILDECRNFLVKGKCDGWVISKFKNDELIVGHDEIIASDDEIADEICAECPNHRLDETRTAFYREKNL